MVRPFSGPERGEGHPIPELERKKKKGKVVHLVTTLDQEKEERKKGNTGDGPALCVLRWWFERGEEREERGGRRRVEIAPRYGAEREKK